MRPGALPHASAPHVGTPRYASAPSLAPARLFLHWLVGDARRHSTVRARLRFLLRCLQLLFLHHQELVLADLVATSPIGGLDHLAGDGIDELLPQAIAGLSVHLPERDPLGGGDGRVQGDRAGNEGQLQKPLPMRTRGHFDYSRHRNADLE